MDIVINSTCLLQSVIPYLRSTPTKSIVVLNKISEACSESFTVWLH